MLGALAVTAGITAIGATGLNVYLNDQGEPDEHVVSSTFDSTVLGEKRGLIVHLPESYARRPDARYPVVYVLDGSSQDGHTARTAALMARIGVMPEVIVVGLPNSSGDGRQRDYTPPFMRMDVDMADSPPGAGDRFLQFLKAEVIPMIERAYRTDVIRVLAGYSRGGLLVVHSLIAEPDLFQARFAFSPALWRDDDVIVTRLEEFLRANAGLEGFLYTSLGSEENEKMTTAWRRAVAVLERHAPPRLRWQADLTPDADHQTNAELSTPVAFKALFEK